MSLSHRFRAFPWDTLADAKAKAETFPGGIVDLSIGTPVDPVPDIAREALRDASDAPGYPSVHGHSELRATAAAWLRRRLGVDGQAEAILPTIGSKEFIAQLPGLLGLGPDSTIGVPELAYPTYEVGARYVGARTVATDSTVSFGPSAPDVMFINSPSNPTGRVLGPEHLQKIVQWARDRRVLIVADECYLEFVWEQDPPAYSILHPAICGHEHDRILAVHSVSKRSNLAGYRAGFVTGDPVIIAELLEVRKHLGAMVPAPVQAAMGAVLNDDAHVDEQVGRYRRRREILRSALEGAGFGIDHSQASLYLWATRGEPCRDTVAWLAERGILVAPGEFYGPAGESHVRIGFTATDERIEAAAQRLAA